MHLNVTWRDLIARLTSLFQVQTCLYPPLNCTTTTHQWLDGHQKLYYLAMLCFAINYLVNYLLTINQHLGGDSHTLKTFFSVFFFYSMKFQWISMKFQHFWLIFTSTQTLVEIHNTTYSVKHKQSSETKKKISTDLCMNKLTLILSILCYEI